MSATHFLLILFLAAMVACVVLSVKLTAANGKSMRLHNLLDACGLVKGDEPTIDAPARVIAEKGNAEQELQQIDHLLHGRAALHGKQSRYEKIAYSLQCNQAAARTGAIPNR